MAPFLLGQNLQMQRRYGVKNWRPRISRFLEPVSDSYLIDINGLG